MISPITATRKYQTGVVLVAQTDTPGHPQTPHTPPPASWLQR